MRLGSDVSHFVHLSGMSCWEVVEVVCSWVVGCVVCGNLNKIFIFIEQLCWLAECPVRYPVGSDALRTTQTTVCVRQRELRHVAERAVGGG